MDSTTRKVDSELPGYQVTLPVFEGPLDLLLHLIEREELDITEISLAQVTNQYIEYLAQISERDPDSLADFLVVAAKLLLIKSRVLLPQPEAPPQSEEDAGEDLVQQLIEYRKFKDAARHLREIEALGRRSYIRLVATPELERSVDLGEVTLDDLLAAVRLALSIKPPAPTVNGTVAPITVTVSGQMALIERKTAGGRAASFTGLLERAKTRLEIIVTLLALLEMVKQLRVTMRQEGHFGDILIVQKEKGPEERSEGSSPLPGPEPATLNPDPQQ